MEVKIRIVRLFPFFLLGLMVCGCSTAYCPDSGTGLGNTCGQTNSTNTTDTTTTTTTGTTSNTTSNTTTNTTTNTTGTGQLYVSNLASSAVERFAAATTANGDIVPSAAIEGSLTQLSSPNYLTSDPTDDRLYVASTVNNAIVIFDGISQTAGSVNINPTRIISGANTQLNQPVQAQLDSTNNLLYVGNAGSDSVLVFANATTVTGNAAPTRVISGAGTQITGLSSIFLDTANDRLWVVNPATPSLLVFQNISTAASGAPNPTRVISGSNTLLSAPRYLLQSGTTLFVSSGASILRFSNSDTLSGNIAPTASITGSLTLLQTPAQLAYNGAADQLYVADPAAESVLVFSSASTASGAPAPTLDLTGSSTGFSSPTGVAIDLTH